MTEQIDDSHEELADRMDKETDEAAEQKSFEIQELIRQLPEEFLAIALAEKIKNDQSELEVTKVVRAVSQQFSGPIPPPQILGDYDKVQAGFAERIVAMAEKEQTHRHVIEGKALSSEISVQMRGQVFALILSLVILCGSMFLIYSGKEIAGSALAGSSLIGLACIFITGRKSKELPD